MFTPSPSFCGCPLLGKGVAFLFPSLRRAFIMNWCWILSYVFFYTCWDDHFVFLLQSVIGVNDVCLIFKPNMHSGINLAHDMYYLFVHLWVQFADIDLGFLNHKWDWTVIILWGFGICITEFYKMNWRLIPF